MPEVVLSPWRSLPCFRTVGEVLQVPEQRGKAVEQVLLSPFDVAEFARRKLLDMFVLRANMAVPTALHAWGAQVLPCPCGCRPFPFKGQSA